MVGLVAVFSGAWWRIPGREIPVIGQIIHLPIIGFATAAVARLLWLRPRRILYALGVLCILVAFTGFWLASPAGGQWTGELLNNRTYGPYGGYMFRLLFLLLQAGWVLLGASVANWKIGIATYLAPGIALALGAALLGAFDLFGATPFWVPFYFLLGWPQVILIALGTFGHTFG